MRDEGIGSFELKNLILPIPPYTVAYVGSVGKDQ